MVTASEGSDASPDVLEHQSTTTDAELLDRLRAGEVAAYEALWLRHVGAARRVAQRLTSVDHDDLVSEAFLAVYRQVAIDGKGPQTSFRAYLFTVMRNLAARWYREGRPFISDPDADAAVDEDGYDRIEREQDDAQLLDAFRALPARWQRVLWLSEIENAGRPAIASELGIGPNAVSALQRRARGGLREQWLLQHVPKELRDDEFHVARDLPSKIAGSSRAAHADIDVHLTGCARCRRVEQDLRVAYGSNRTTTASISGLAALGVILPSATTLWAAPTSISIAAGVGFTLIGSAAAFIGALTLTIGTALFPWPFVAPFSAAEIVIPTSAPDDADTTDVPLPFPVATTPPTPQAPTPPRATAPPSPEQPEAIDFWQPDGALPPLEPTRPAPEPAEPGTVPGPSDPQTGASPQVQTAQPASTFMAPVMSGTSSEPGSTVAIGVADDVYTVTPDPDGAWSFDMRSLALPAGNHTAEVWTVRDGVASPATQVPFTIDTISLTGFEGDVLMDQEQASTEGLIFTAIGPASGAICVSSDTGQSAQLPTDADGTLTRRIRFLTTGFYAMSFAACDDGYTGPSVDAARWVSSGIFDPWGEEPYFEIEDVDQIDSTDGNTAP